MANDSTDAGDGGVSRPSPKADFNQPAWFTPERLLAILCCINLLNYLDRGAIASNGVNGLQANSTCVHSAGSATSCNEASGIVGEFSLSYFQDGILSSAFMVGLLIASPIFAELSKSFNPMRLIGTGLSVWTVATAGCGVSFNFWSIAFFRAMVGVAEASFISLAAPFIDDYAPPGRRTAWLSLFYSCIPVGVAMGYVYGGLVGGALGWRSAFWIESLFMLPFAVFGFVSKPVQLKRASHEQHNRDHQALLKDADGGAGRSRNAGDGDSAPGLGLGFGSYWKALGGQGIGILRDIKKLSARKVYVFDVVGYVAYTFVVGAYAYWGPKVGEVLFNLPNSDIVFGGLTIIAGIFGTLFGGFALDRLGATIPTAFKFLGVSCGIGGVFCMMAFSVSSLYLFIPLFLIGEFAIFATQGPVNFVTLHSVPPQDRPIAIAISTVAIHVFGDVPSSPLVGEFEDLIDDWRLTSQLLTSVLLVAAAVWGCGSFVAPQGREEESLWAGDSHLTLEDGAQRDRSLLSDAGP